MATKAYRRFVQRIDYYGTDLELCDLLVRQFFALPNSEVSLAQALDSTDERHPFLSRRQNNKRSRAICGMHLKHTLHVAFVKDLFEDFSEFLSDTMTKAALRGIDPARFVGEVKLDIHASDFLAAGNWDAAVRLVSDAIFRKLENERNTRDLIRKASVRLGLQIDQAILDSAMPYLDARHMLVHRDGGTDEQYRNDYPAIALNNNKITVDYPFVAEAKRTVSALALDIDNRILAAGLVRQQDIAGQR